jgi:hypothetical protein
MRSAACEHPAIGGQDKATTARTAAIAAAACRRKPMPQRRRLWLREMTRPTMQKPNKDESINLLASLRAVAGQHDDIHERAMFGCPGFFAGTAMVACVYGDQIVLKLRVDRVTALLRTPGCSYFKPYDRAPMRQWLAFGTSSPAFDALADLFGEAVSFSQATPPKGKRPKRAPAKG